MCYYEVLTSLAHEERNVPSNAITLQLSSSPEHYISNIQNCADVSKSSTSSVAQTMTNLMMTLTKETFHKQMDASLVCHIISLDAGRTTSAQ